RTTHCRAARAQGILPAQALPAGSRAVLGRVVDGAAGGPGEWTAAHLGLREGSLGATCALSQSPDLGTAETGPGRSTERPGPFSSEHKMTRDQEPRSCSLSSSRIRSAARSEA